MTKYRAVLFDWRRTLVHDPDLSWWVTQALTSVGRPADDAAVTSIIQRVDHAFREPEYVEREPFLDTSAELHRTALMAAFEQAGLDPPLAKALYERDLDPASHPLYPDVSAALTAIHELGIKTALVSNIHFDLRPELAEQGILDMLDAVVLSFERGIQKPDPRMFEMALDALGVRAGEAVMVGDSATNDGAAAAVGITTVILPTLGEFGPRAFGPVLNLLRG